MVKGFKASVTERKSGQKSINIPKTVGYQYPVGEYFVYLSKKPFLEDES